MSTNRAPRARKSEAAPPPEVNLAPLEEELDAALAQIAQVQASGKFEPMSKALIELTAPCACQVYEEGWYFALVIEVAEDRVFYLTTANDGDVLRSDLTNFLSKAKFNPVYTPVHTAIYFLSRDRSGLSSMRVRELRRLAAMITREELEKMSERELGQAYRRMVDPNGPQRIKTDKRAEHIEKILASVKDQTAKKDAEGNAVEEKPKKERKPKAPKEAKAPREKKVKAPKEPKKSAKEIKANGGNPYREGSMKRVAFDVFITSKGNRDKTIEAAVKAGATQSTAVSWFAAFNKLG